MLSLMYIYNVYVNKTTDIVIIIINISAGKPSSREGSRDRSAGPQKGSKDQSNMDKGKRQSMTAARDIRDVKPGKTDTRGISGTSSKPAVVSSVPPLGKPGLASLPPEPKPVAMAKPVEPVAMPDDPTQPHR